MSEHDHFAEQSLRETAYFLWEQSGRPEGRDQEFWYLARTRQDGDTDSVRPTHQTDDNQDDLGRDINQ